MALQVQVFDKQTKSLKHAENLNTSDPQQCLWAILAIWTAGGNIAENMAKIPIADKEKLFDYLNDEAAFPAERYTKRVEEIHEALALELA